MDFSTREKSEFFDAFTFKEISLALISLTVKARYVNINTITVKQILTRACLFLYP